MIKYGIGYFELIEYEDEDFNENNTNKAIEDIEISPPIEEYDEYADMPELVYIDDLKEETESIKNCGYTYFSTDELNDNNKIYTDNGNLVKNNISIIVSEMLSTQSYINQSDNKKYNSDNDECDSDNEMINEIRNLYNSKN